MPDEAELTHIAEDLRPLAVPIDDLVEDPANANIHDERSIRAIMASYARYGQRKPIVVNRNGNIIEAGNGQLDAARELGWTHIAAVFVDDDPTTHAGFAIADNRTAQLSHFDDDALARLIASVRSEDPDAPLDTMYDDEELAALMAKANLADGEAPGADPGPAEPDHLGELIEKWGTERGQLWLIHSKAFPGAAHRLLCGDATDAEDVTRLMDGQRAALFATDPPYLVDYDGTNHPGKDGYSGKNKDWGESYHDWDDSAQGRDLYDGFVAAAIAHAITENAAWYCWHASRRQAMLEAVWEDHGAFVHQQIIWVKDRGVLTRSWYLWQHEPCFFGWIKGSKPKRCTEDYPSGVWTIPTIKPGEKTLHPTSKPVEVFAIPMQQHTDPGDICYEPFAGSGSQFVAGEQAGRLVYGLELQPAYVAVILERLSGMGLTCEIESAEGIE
jgi:DNA modification methylase